MRQCLRALDSRSTVDDREGKFWRTLTSGNVVRRLRFAGNSSSPGPQFVAGNWNRQRLVVVYLAPLVFCGWSGKSLLKIR
jgi:hypothetical protein